VKNLISSTNLPGGFFTLMAVLVNALKKFPNSCEYVQVNLLRQKDIAEVALWRV